MKSVVKPAEESGRPFPKLMTIKRTGLIVLFTDHTNGTVVKEDEFNSIGICAEWEYLIFTDFDGTVTLSND